MKKFKICILIFCVVLIVSSVLLGWFISLNSDTNVDLDNVNDNADNLNLILSCDKDIIKYNEELLCSLSGNSVDYDVSAISANIESNSSLKITKVIPHSSWEGDGDMGDVDLYTDINKRDEFDILTFYVKLVSNDVDKVVINIVDNIFVDEKFAEHILEDISKTLVVG